VGASASQRDLTQSARKWYNTSASQRDLTQSARKCINISNAEKIILISDSGLFCRVGVGGVISILYGGQKCREE